MVRGAETHTSDLCTSLRCFVLAWLRLQKEAPTADVCHLEREDYLECLHNARKRMATLYVYENKVKQIEQQKLQQQQKQNGDTPNDDSKGENGH